MRIVPIDQPLTVRDVLKEHLLKMPIRLMSKEEFDTTPVDWGHMGNPAGRGETSPFLSLHEQHNDFGHFVYCEFVSLVPNPRAGEMGEWLSIEPSHHQKWLWSRVHLFNGAESTAGRPAIVRGYTALRHSHGQTDGLSG